MKVILDTNIYISYLLTKEPEDTISQVFELCVVESNIELLLPKRVIDELFASISNSKYLSSHISHAQATSLVRDIRKASTVLKPAVEETYPVINVRDPKDQYLLDMGISYEADYLVTGDSDLLIIGQISKLRIVDPHQFVLEIELMRTQQHEE